MPDKSSIELISILRPLGEKKRYARGEFLFGAGDSIRGFFHVASGEVRVFRMDEQGREVEVARLGRGDFLAEAVTFAAKVYPAFAQAVRDAECLFFHKDKVMSRMAKDPRVAKAFLGLLAHKCLVLNNRIESLGLLTVRQRLARFLLSRCSGSMQCAVDLSMKKGELARALGTASETLSRTLRQMSREGLIEVRGRAVTIKDCSSLRAELGR